MQRIVVVRRSDRKWVANWYSKKCLELWQARAAWEEFASECGIAGEYDVYLVGECEDLQEEVRGEG